MKKQYKIIKHTDNGDLFYNEDFNIFTEKFGTIYTNKQKAEHKKQYAIKYASNKNEVVEVVKF